MRTSKKNLPKFLWAAGFVIIGFAMGIACTCTGLSSAQKNAIVSGMQKEIGQTMSVRFIGNRLFLEGIAANDYEADRAVEIAKAYLGIATVSGRGVASNSAPMDPKGPVLVDMLRVSPPAKKTK